MTPKQRAANVRPRLRSFVFRVARSFVVNFASFACSVRLFAVEEQLAIHARRRRRFVDVAINRNHNDDDAVCEEAVGEKHVAVGAEARLERSRQRPL